MNSKCGCVDYLARSRKLSLPKIVLRKDIEDEENVETSNESSMDDSDDEVTITVSKKSNIFEDVKKEVFTELIKVINDLRASSDDDKIQSNIFKFTKEKLLTEYFKRLEIDVRSYLQMVIDIVETQWSIMAEYIRI